MEERRQLIRHHLELPIVFSEGVGMTRDLNVGGVFFESRERFEVLKPISFSILFGGRSSTPLQLHCRGRVVRVVPDDKVTGVAATIDAFWLDPHEN